MAQKKLENAMMQMTRADNTRTVIYKKTINYLSQANRWRFRHLKLPQQVDRASRIVTVKFYQTLKTLNRIECFKWFLKHELSTRIANLSRHAYLTCLFCNLCIMLYFMGCMFITNLFANLNNLQNMFMCALICSYYWKYTVNWAVILWIKFRSLF